MLVISIARIRKRHSREKHKKSSTAAGDVTPIHSDDDKNPDVIPQIEGKSWLNSGLKMKFSFELYILDV